MVGFWGATGEADGISDVAGAIGGAVGLSGVAVMIGEATGDSDGLSGVAVTFWEASGDSDGFSGDADMFLEASGDSDGFSGDACGFSNAAVSCWIAGDFGGSATACIGVDVVASSFMPAICLSLSKVSVVALRSSFLSCGIMSSLIMCFSNSFWINFSCVSLSILVLFYVRLGVVKAVIFCL